MSVIDNVGQSIATIFDRVRDHLRTKPEHAARIASGPGIKQWLLAEIRAALNWVDPPVLAANQWAVIDSRKRDLVVFADTNSVSPECWPAAHVVQVPAFHGSAVALFVSAADIREWPQRLRSGPGVILVESDEASGFIDAIGQEAVLVRMGMPAAGGSAIWCTFDGARIAALSALWIAETIAFAAS